MAYGCGNRKILDIPIRDVYAKYITNGKYITLDRGKSQNDPILCLSLKKNITARERTTPYPLFSLFWKKQLWSFSQFRK